MSVRDIHKFRRKQYYMANKKMIIKSFASSLTLLLVIKLCKTQVLQFGTCVEVETMKFFDLERFLGTWYEIERFPAWYESYGHCAYKHVQYCGRRIEIEHVFIRDGIQYILHVNSTYTPGDDAVFVIQESNIDPVGIPMSVISTDYSNYALVYGCKNNEDMGIKYITAWILSRETTLSDDILQKVHEELNSIPNANLAYLEPVHQSRDKCTYYWTAHIQAVNVEDDE